MQMLLLEDVKRRLERWRRSRQGCGRIPHEFWKMAADAAAVHGTDETARVLRLDAKRLRQWMLDKGQKQCPPANPAFVELPPWTPPPEPECTFELEDAAGRQLRVCLKGQATAHAVNLARLFWREDES